MKPKGEVEVHSKEPLNFLLCGNMPIVSSRIPQKKVKKQTLGVQDSNVFDFSVFPPLITTLRKDRPRGKTRLVKSRQSQECSTHLYQKIKRDQYIFTEMENDLSLRADNKKRKIAQIHQDYEDRVSRPFQERLGRAISGERYKRFKEEKTRAITALGPRPAYSTITVDEPYTVPVVRVSTSGLSDRIYSFQKNEKRDKILEEEVLSNSTDYNPTEKRVMYKELRPANEILARIAETRVFNEEPNKHYGRRTFAKSFSSNVGKSLYTLE